MATQNDEKTQIEELRQAVRWAEKNHPLPRCPHGNALKDHAGELLAPSCGCRAMRTVFLDYDARRNPKTGRFCIRCQKDIKPGAKARVVRLIGDPSYVVHPEDMRDGVGQDYLVGMDCARILGMEFTRPER